MMYKYKKNIHTHLSPTYLFLSFYTYIHTTYRPRRRGARARRHRRRPGSPPAWVLGGWLVGVMSFNQSIDPSIYPSVHIYILYIYIYVYLSKYIFVSIPGDVGLGDAEGDGLPEDRHDAADPAHGGHAHLLVFGQWMLVFVLNIKYWVFVYFIGVLILVGVCCVCGFWVKATRGSCKTSCALLSVQFISSDVHAGPGRRGGPAACRAASGGGTPPPPCLIMLYRCDPVH